MSFVENCNAQGNATSSETDSDNSKRDSDHWNGFFFSYSIKQYAQPIAQPQFEFDKAEFIERKITYHFHHQCLLLSSSPSEPDDSIR